jgi:hypothetical protein
LLTCAKGTRLAICTTCARTGERRKGLLNVVGLGEIDIRKTNSLASDINSTYENNTRAFESDVLKIDKM